MFTLDIVIPTINRVEKLQKCLNSIFISASIISINLYIYFSVKSELEYFSDYLKNVPNVSLRYVKEYRVPDFWNSYLKNMTSSDAMFYINDDVLFFPDTITSAISEFKNYFPDNDGILGVNQSNLPADKTVKSAFGIIGKKYSERFPDNQVFPPMYDRFFADWEVGEYANSINKFVYCEEVKIEHLHPLTDARLLDETHRKVRHFWSQDHKTFLKRREQNLLWGNSFTI